MLIPVSRRTDINGRPGGGGRQDHNSSAEADFKGIRAGRHVREVEQ